MNYLAHAYLSFGDEGLLCGNMISDFVKGRKKFDYPPGIRAGIELHRSIDEFTDNHPATKEIKSFFRQTYRLYSGAFADVVYDYFLANDTKAFPAVGQLLSFTENAYNSLKKNESMFPEKFSMMFPYMRSQNWLFQYREEEGIQKSFGGLQRRALYIAETETAFKIFHDNIPAMQTCSDIFLPEVKDYAFVKAAQLLKSYGLTLKKINA